MLSHKKVYECITDLIKDCRQSLPNQQVWKHDRDFVGRDLPTWDGIEKAVNEPWQDGLDVVQGMLFEIDREQQSMAPPRDIRRRKRWGDQGDELDMDRLRGGQDAWLETSRQEVRAPRQVTIIAHIGARGVFTSSEMLWRGALAICLADLLERNGYRCELWMASYGMERLERDSQNDMTFLACKLKGTSEPVDISGLTNVVSGWFYRTVVFQSFAYFGRVNKAVGSTQQLTTELECVGELAGNSLPVVIDGIYSKQAALDLVRKVITKLEGTPVS